MLKVFNKAVDFQLIFFCAAILVGLCVSAPA